MLGELRTLPLKLYDVLPDLRCTNPATNPLHIICFVQARTDQHCDHHTIAADIAFMYTFNMFVHFFHYLLYEPMQKRRAKLAPYN